MTSTPLAYAERRMQQRWYDLAMAEQNGATVQVLERMYNAYIRAVDEYNRHLAVVQSQPQPAPPSEPGNDRHASELHTEKRKKKAS